MDRHDDDKTRDDPGDTERKRVKKVGQGGLREEEGHTIMLSHFFFICWSRGSAWARRRDPAAPAFCWSEARRRMRSGGAGDEG